MKKEPKLFKIIRALNVEDIGRVKKMLKSPFFTQNKNLPVLFNYLIQYYPSLESKKLDKNLVIKKIFKGKSFSDSKYSNLCFECTRLIEQFLIIKKREQDEMHRNAELRDIYFDKLGGALHSNNFSLYKNAEDRLGRLIETDKNAELSNADQEFSKFQFYKKKLKHIDFKKLNERITIYNKSLTALENFYQIKKAILKTERINLIGYLGVENPPDPKIEYFHNFYFKIFNLLKHMIGKEDFKAYQRAKELAFENVGVMAEETREDIFQLFKNFLIRGQSKNAALYTPELAKLLSEIVENEYLVKGALFKSLDYLNTIITLAPVDLKKAIKFQKNYKKYLSDKDIVDAEQLSIAHILYHQKKLRESFAKVSTHKFTRHMTEMMARVHELRCGYEIFETDDNFGELYSDKLINIGKQFKRSEMSPAKRISVENLVVMLKKLVKRDLNKDFTKETENKLLSEINNMKHLTSRQWLCGKVMQKK